MRPNDPRIRQTINEISQSLESANESAQERLYAFSRNYLEPCFGGVNACLGSCTASCFPSGLRRRRRGRSTIGRTEFNFGFYDDWDYDDDAQANEFYGWENDELDRLLAGNGNGGEDSGADTITNDQPPAMPRRMSYGSRGPRRSGGLSDERQNGTALFGLFKQFPWKVFGGRSLKYRPSAADLQEHPGQRPVPSSEGDDDATRPFLSDEDYNDSTNNDRWHPEERGYQGYSPGSKDETQRRVRSSTASSQHTNNTSSSRGDLIPTDEDDDAVPLNDSLAMALATVKSGHSLSDPERSSRHSIQSPSTASSDIPNKNPFLSLSDLKKQEMKVAQEEESAIERKRKAASNLARERGLTMQGQSNAQRSHLEVGFEPLLFREILLNDFQDKSTSNKDHKTPGHSRLSPHIRSSSDVTSSAHTGSLPPPTQHLEYDECHF